jgi:DNA-binding transcriptional regulator GbsR (MarR family)
MISAVSASRQRAPVHAPEAELRFIERFALLMTEAGMARMPARVFAAVLADEDGRMTASELADRLQVSPAAISGAVRQLVQLHMLSRGREPGARRDHYEMVHDQWPEMFVYRTAVLESWEEALADGVELFGEGPAAQRLDETRAFFAFVRGELPALMERWRAHRAGASVR